MANRVLDVIIVGAGPAGLTAALYCARSGLSIYVIGKVIGGQAAESSLVENYPGFKHITGFELMSKLVEQVEALGVRILNDEVVSVEQHGDVFMVKTSWSGDFRCKALILAIGAEPSKMGIKGEEEFRGRGVSYCATCDGPLFKGKDVAVIGGGNSALDAALYLSSLTKTTYLIHRRGEFRAAKALVDKVNERSNIIKKLNKVPVEIGGRSSVEWIKIRDVTSGVEEQINVSAVFVEVGRRVNSNFLRGFVELDEQGQIIVDPLCRTSRRGVFAAGDATTIPYKQIVIAAGEGAKAALSAYEYLKALRS
ncbi:MAG: thioredoxin-disulfide reductase [Candidatus Nezhaarchaeota archaeon]|nr:thioredoxin-disulfide reductase [Candidatus Nezhaarchaeota archaeon]MCX8141618.1 thioredoxin-disulfide reductase [Candidatus Nezhaarchaeota archaeon]MDW8049885.1 thioredoxin-disulfide reductase [Nitrososphaerota archaeon]